MRSWRDGLMVMRARHALETKRLAKKMISAIQKKRFSLAKVSPTSAFTCCDAAGLNCWEFALRGDKKITDSVFSRRMGRKSRLLDCRIRTASAGLCEFNFFPNEFSRLATKSVSTGSPLGSLRWKMALERWIFCGAALLAGDDCWSNTAEWRFDGKKSIVFSRRKLRTKFDSLDGSSAFFGEFSLMSFWSKLLRVKIPFLTRFSSFNWLFMSSIFRFSWYAKLIGALIFRPSMLLIDERSGKNFSKFHSLNRTASSFSDVDVDDPVVPTEDDDWLARFYLNSISCGGICFDFYRRQAGRIYKMNRNDNWKEIIKNLNKKNAKTQNQIKNEISGLLSPVDIHEFRGWQEDFLIVLER